MNINAKIESARADLAQLVATSPDLLAPTRTLHDLATATARRLLHDLFAQRDALQAQPAADEVVRVRGLTYAQAGWLADPTLGHGSGYTLAAVGRTWIEGTRAQLQLAMAAADGAGEGMFGEEIAAAADADAAQLPEHLRDGYMDRRITRTLRCIAVASAKVASVLEGRKVAAESATHGNAAYLLARLG